MKLTRRHILSGAILAAAAGASVSSNPFSALANITIGPRGKKKATDTLVVIFLRGGADGLNIVPPYFEDRYYKLRPTLALPMPTDAGVASGKRALDLDSKFGLHPALAPILPLFHDGKMAVIHAVGSGDTTRSHFEAMATMERGNAASSGASSGWLARHLNATAEDIESPLRAVAVTETMPESLRGASNTTALMQLSDYRLSAYRMAANGNHPANIDDDRTAALNNSLRAMYNDGGSSNDAVCSAGKETLSALDAVKRLDPAHYAPAPGVKYPKEELGTGLRQVACLIKGDVGLEVACLDLGGWDTHVAQGATIGFQAARLSELGGAVAAFTADLGNQMSNVTVLIMTEFGRRAYENTGLGTDHGRGSCMFVIGGGVNGGKVYTKWPGLAEDKLQDGGDLRVTTDYRDVLAEILARRCGNNNLGAVFADFTPTAHSILRSIT